MSAKPETRFVRACSTGKADVVRSLIQEGVSPDTRDSYGLTGLIWAGRKGQIGVADVLMNSGCNMNSRDRRGRTALFHWVCFKRYEFVEHLAVRRADLDPVDMHGMTPLDYASSTNDARMIELLKRFGAWRKKSQGPSVEREYLNRFGTGGAVGGPDQPIEVERVRVQLDALFSQWKGNYTSVIRGMYFPLFEDGSVVQYTREMNIVGPQQAKRRGNWSEAKIGVPTSWWTDGEQTYKRRLVGAIEDGLKSMIALLERNKHEIKSEQLLADWNHIKNSFLSVPAPPFAAEGQRQRLASLVREAVEKRKGRRPS